MTLRIIPAAADLNINAKDMEWVPPREAMAKWNPTIRAESDDKETTITIYDVIGRDPWTGEGVTLKRVDAALRSIGPKDVTVNVNSPGGSVFEGLGIYEAFRQHKAKVTMNVMAMAASAASVIAMAGDEIRVAPGGFVFVHNAWGLAIGNKNDLTKASEDLDQFDGAMRGIYTGRSGASEDDVKKWMDEETFMNAKTAIDRGFADNELPPAEIREEESEETKNVKAIREVEHALAQAGYSRSKRRSLLSAIKSDTPNAVALATQDAGDSEIMAGLHRLRETISN